MPTTPTPSRPRLPRVVGLLAAGTFLMGTTEFVVAGLLPQIAGDLGVSLSGAGLLITLFAVGMIVGAPTTTLLTLRLPRRLVLVCALLVFALGHVVIALGPNLSLVLGARFVTALATGAFWSVAMVVAAGSVGPESSARAIGVVVSGGISANVVGVPLGAVVGQAVGWRGTFWALAVIAVFAAVLMQRAVPTGTHDGPRSLRTEFAALRSGRVWWALLACAGVIGGVLSAYAFITPLLTARADLSPRLVPLVLIAFGVGAVIGVAVGGRLGDRWPVATGTIGAGAAALALAGLALTSTNAVAVTVFLAAAALAGFTTNPCTISLVVRAAADAPTLASALSTSFFNLGIAAGSALAGLSLTSRWGLQGPAFVGTAFALWTAVPLVLLALRSRNARPGAARIPRPSAQVACGDHVAP